MVLIRHILGIIIIQIAIIAQIIFAKENNQMENVPVYLEKKILLQIPLNQPPYNLIYNQSPNHNYCAKTIKYIPHYGLACADPGPETKPHLKFVHLSPIGELVSSIDVAQKLGKINALLWCSGIYLNPDHTITLLIGQNYIDYELFSDFILIKLENNSNNPIITKLPFDSESVLSPLFTIMPKQNSNYCFEQYTHSTGEMQYSLMSVDFKNHINFPMIGHLGISSPNGSLIILGKDNPFANIVYEVDGKKTPLKLFGSFGCTGFESQKLIPGESAFFAHLLINQKHFRPDGHGMYQSENMLQLCYYNNEAKSVFLFPCHPIIPELTDTINSQEPNIFETIYFSDQYTNITIDANGDTYVTTLKGSTQPALIVYKYEFNPKALELLPEAIRPKQIAE
jgi:hypothetical protein